LTEFLTSIDWPLYIGAGSTIVLAILAITRVIVKLTPSKDDDKIFKAVEAVLLPVVERVKMSTLLRTEDDLLEHPRKSTKHGVRVIRGENVSPTEPKE